MGDYFKNLVSLGTATLGSSCCLIQLALNVFGFGCAGFAALTPYQPIFASLTLASLGYSLRRSKNWNSYGVAASCLLILLSPYLIAQLNLSGLTDSKEYITCEVQGAKCQGCLNDVKTRLSEITNITGVSAQFRSEELRIADVSISASWPIPQNTLQNALKEEHKLNVISRVTVVREDILPQSLVNTWIIKYSDESNFNDEVACLLSKEYAKLPYVQHFSTFIAEKQHTIVASYALDEQMIKKAAETTNNVKIVSIQK